MPWSMRAELGLPDQRGSVDVDLRQPGRAVVAVDTRFTSGAAAALGLVALGTSVPGMGTTLTFALRSLARSTEKLARRFW